MSKYAALGDYLREQTRDEVPMSFAQIERLTGGKLPNSHRYRAWWSNNPLNSVMTKVWLDAGFMSERVDMKSGRLVFRRIRSRKPSQLPPSASGSESPSGRHPLLGALKGLVRVAPGADLTKPVDEEWGDRD